MADFCWVGASVTKPLCNDLVTALLRLPDVACVLWLGQPLTNSGDHSVSAKINARLALFVIPNIYVVVRYDVGLVIDVNVWTAIPNKLEVL